MKPSFSTLACPDWKIEQIVELATRAGYDGIELRFVEGEGSLWKLPAFTGTALLETRQKLADRGLLVSCVDTGCFFHYPSLEQRLRSKTEGERMTDLAVALQSPGIRVFGDSVQPGSTREATVEWIAEGISNLAEIAGAKGVEVWLETHGDFASSRGTLEILNKAHSSMIGTVWDPANCMATTGEKPANGAKALGRVIRHVHIKDLCRNEQGNWSPVLTGHGDLPVIEVLTALRDQNYAGFVSLEWEKKWHPEIADADIAVPQFMEWWNEHRTSRE
jgi:sugar phosphate isomerase/epimerase